MSTTSERSTTPVSPTRGATVNDLCARLEQAHAGEPLLCDFARLFFAKVPRQLLQERDMEDLVALTTGAFRFLERSRPDAVNVQVLNPEEEGWKAPVTLIRAEVGDRPFIVDTIREYLAGENLAIHHYIYPVLRVDRDSGGRINGVGAPPEGNLEALVHCEVTRIPDAERRAEIGEEIQRRLGDVIAATSDFSSMVAALDDTIQMVEGYRERFPKREREWEEMLSFLRWLRDEHFVFLGYRAYDIDLREGEPVIRVEEGSGLGILREESESTYSEPVPLAELSEPLRQRILGGPGLIISKSNAEATVHRRARMDYVGVKKLDEEGRVIGERRFLGLFTSRAYAENADDIPILRRKLKAVLRESGAVPGSHDYKEIITIFNSMPKEDLFQASTDELEREVQTVLALLFADEVRVSLRPDPIGRGVSVMALLPRGRFSAAVRHRIQDMLAREFEGTVLNYHLAMSAGDQARLHFYLSAPSERVGAITEREIEREIRKIIRSWEDRLYEELETTRGAADAESLVPLYGPAFPEEYRAATPPVVAARDVAQLEKLRMEEARVAIGIYAPALSPGYERLEGMTLLKVYLREERLILSDFLPILENTGLRVVEVTPFEVSGEELPRFMIYTFAVQGPEQETLPTERAQILAETILAVRRGDTANDSLNVLVLRTGLRWREVDVLRAYLEYAFQAGLVPSRGSMFRALEGNPDVARSVFQLFQTRFDPELSAGREETMAQLHEAVCDTLDRVASLSDDRALRRLLGLVGATTRTNFFRHGGPIPTATSGGVPYISLKIRSADIDELRKNRLLYEVFVHSANMEGIHLRGAPVSRGGIRWSDRPDDFRTEILGLVQTQIVKNAVIVPAGSKGGFVTRRSFPDRDEMMQEAKAQYQTLIRGMLDITDNLAEGEVVPPPRVVRHDGDDPYLVVAADKGTAHLSDVANAISADYGFWLGDAFASGGSHGYDHKKEGITARGAWECVKRHFREMGKDIQAEPFTVAGIGDMSGDVFGNGMLLSRQIRLVAAFDHRHIFIDPDPDPEVGYAERERLFRLPRSSWEDYDRSKLSAGGMIVPRASKEVLLTPEVRAALGISEAVERMDGETVVRAVLKAPVELLWNGGIGTYVKDQDETNADVGDTANDPVRINADELQCKVVGEGGNLGLTQQARITYALRGGRINTDALDNSAGVDMSDHEVNLKILLNPMVTTGELDPEARNELLEAMTDEVSQLVLQNNFDQSLAVSLDEVRSREALGDFAALITAFERDKLLERGTEGIPSSDTIQERAEEGLGLTRPTLAVLLAYSKLHAQSSLLETALPDEAATERYLVEYFPPAAVEAAGLERLREHRLRREIVTTQLINDLVDLMGASFLHRVSRDTGRAIPEVVRAWYIASQISGAAEIRGDLARLEGEFPSETIHRWLFGLARVLERTTRWALANVAPDAPAGAVIEEHLEGLTRLRAEFTNLVAGEDRALFLARLEELKQLGADGPLAARLITLRFLPELLDILRTAREAAADAVETARAYYLVSERLDCGALQQRLRAAGRDEVWEKRLVQALLEDVGRAHRAVTHAVLDCEERGMTAEVCLNDLEAARSREVKAYREVVAEVNACDPVPLAGLAVAVRTLAEIGEA